MHTSWPTSVPNQLVEESGAKMRHYRLIVRLESHRSLLPFYKTASYTIARHAGPEAVIAYVNKNACLSSNSQITGQDGPAALPVSFQRVGIPVYQHRGVRRRSRTERDFPPAYASHMRNWVMKMVIGRGS